MIKVHKKWKKKKKELNMGRKISSLDMRTSIYA